MDLRNIMRRRIRQARTARGLHLNDLSGLLRDRYGIDVSDQTLGQIERGRRQLRADELVIIAAALGVHPLSFLVPDRPGTIVLGGIDIDAAAFARWLLTLETTETHAGTVLERTPWRDPADLARPLTTTRARHRE